MPSPSVIRGQKTFRAPGPMIEALEARSLLETAASGRDVTCSEIILRALSRELSVPMPTKRQRRCLAVRTAGDGTKCLTCGKDGSGRSVRCPDDDKVVTRG